MTFKTICKEFEIEHFLLLRDDDSSIKDASKRVSGIRDCMQRFDYDHPATERAMLLGLCLGKFPSQMAAKRTFWYDNFAAEF